MTRTDTGPRQSPPDPADQTEDEGSLVFPDPTIARGRKRAQRQQGCLLLMSLWVIGWTSLFVNGLIHYNVWPVPVKAFALLTLFLSPFTLIFSAPLAFAGYGLGALPSWKPYRWHVTVALPLLGAIAIQIPTAVTRLDPSRKFSAIMGIQLPEGARLLNYQSRFEGIDNSYVFELSIPEDQFEPFYAELAKSKHDATSKAPKKDRITRDFHGSMLEVQADRAASTMTVSWVNY